MIFEIGTKYQVTFTADFNTLDGVYEVMGLYTYQQILDQSIDLYTELYALVGKTEDALLADLKLYTKNTFVRMINVNNTSIVVTAPSGTGDSAVIQTIDNNVQVYYGTMLLVDLGLFDEPLKVEPITTVVLNAIRDRLGNPDLTLNELAAVADISELNKFTASLKVYAKQWMHPSTYTELAARRKAAQEKAEALGGQSHQNYCELYLNLYKEHAVAVAKIAALEEALTTIMEKI